MYRNIRRISIRKTDLLKARNQVFLLCDLQIKQDKLFVLFV